ncbi:MAG: fructose-bisphosphate aldolase [Microbacteriaceae bacterium]|jgi:class I fructose-bisphosphate aldolase|nr:fructose-bisphosphate aldolase [Microbacteriaceae bacterium]
MTFTQSHLSALGATSAVGRSTRLKRLLGPTGKAVFVALDQAVPRGVAPQLASIDATFDAVKAGRPNAITMTRGIGARLTGNDSSPLPWIYKASVFSLEYHKTIDAVVGSVDDAVRLGADAVAVGISLGGASQAKMLEMLTGVVERASTLGMPTVCHAYPSGELWGDRQGSSESVLYAARAAAELGVDIVKTWYTGSTESFAEVVAGTPALVMAAGGAKGKTELETLELAASVMDAGGAGITFGRNVWGAKNPTKMIEALRAVVHTGSPVAEAARLLG